MPRDATKFDVERTITRPQGHLSAGAKKIRENTSFVISWIFSFTRVPRIISTEQSADADEDQVTNSDHNRQLNYQHRDSKQDLDDAQRNSGGGQDDWDANGDHKDREQNHSYYSDNIRGVLHLCGPHFLESLLASQTVEQLISF